jgi:superfamily II DNA helicase RecQ
MAVPVDVVSGFSRTSRARRRRRLRPESAVGSVSHAQDLDSGVSGSAARPPDQATVDALREWRLAEARRRAIAPFIILHDRTLMAIAAARPQSTAELLAVPGIGPGKATEYGDAIVSVVRGHS